MMLSEDLLCDNIVNLRKQRQVSHQQQKQIMLWDPRGETDYPNTSERSEQH